MKAFMRQLGLAVALCGAVAALTGSALAAPPSTPPGHEKKAEAAATEEQKAPPGQEKKADAAEAEAALAQENGINAGTAGVKPANDTDKHTSCETGGSMPSPTCTRDPHGDNPPDSSKRYGHGTTAAQIATSRGAPAQTEIRGPGNSQPHKVCGKNGNWVDVHAVKSYSGASACVQASASAQPATAAATATGISANAAAPSHPSASASATPGAAVTATPVGQGSAGDVAGVSSEAGVQGESAGVLGAFGVLAASGTLPFTGLALWTIVLVGLAAVVVGVALRRVGRTARELA